MIGQGKVIKKVKEVEHEIVEVGKVKGEIKDGLSLYFVLLSVTCFFGVWKNTH